MATKTADVGKAAETIDHVEIVEIPVVIPAELLEENPEFAKNYNAETGLLTYSIQDTLPKEFVDGLKEVLGDFKPAQLIELNPLIMAIDGLQDLKKVKYQVGEDGKDNSQEFKDGKKVIGSFNTSLKTTKAKLKEPYAKIIKTIDAIFNLADTESTNTKNALFSNFKTYLDEVAAEAEKKEKAKKAKELEAIANLTQENSENAEKLKAQSKQTRKLEIENSINRIASSLQEVIFTLNEDGLKQRYSNITDLTLERFFNLAIDQDMFTDDDRLNFNYLFQNVKTGAMQSVNRQIQALANAAELTNQQNENAVLKASQPDLPAPAADENPLADIPAPTANTEAPVMDQPITDEQKFKIVVDMLWSLHSQVLSVQTTAATLITGNPYIDGTMKIVDEKSLAQIQDWTGKLHAWTEQKYNAYIEHLNQNK